MSTPVTVKWVVMYHYFEYGQKTLILMGVNLLMK